MNLLYFIIFLIFGVVPSTAFAFRQSATCIRIQDVDPLAPTAAPRCSGNERPFPFAWPKITVGYQISRTGSDDFPNTNAFNATLKDEIDASFDQWGNADCSKFVFEFDRFAENTGHKIDEINWVGFIESDWPHTSGAIAITTITTELDGTMIDADIELNGEETTFAIVDEESTEEVYDIRNVITHEAGHMLGLDHSAEIDATMQFSSPPRQVKKGSLHSDDVQGVCAIYELDFEPPEPEPPTDQGCCGTVVSANRYYSLATLPFLLLFMRRRAHKQ